MRPGRRRWAAFAALLAITLALVHVTIIYPRVHVRWRADLSASERTAREQKYHLQRPEPTGADTWAYLLTDTSRENVGALVHDPDAVDTAYIDRDQLRVPAPERRIALRNPPFPIGTDDNFPDARRFFHVQSLILLLCGAGLLGAARLDSDRRRRQVAVAVVLVAGALAYALPIDPSMLRMGDADTYIRNRRSFEAYSGFNGIRYEAHLSYALLGRIYDWYGESEDAPREALDTLMRIATAWFVVSALTIGFIERWSRPVVRYLGLVLLAPATLLYFGYREIGYLSLNVAAFPLMLHGMRRDDRRLEAGSFFAGLGAALHGFGLLSVFGGWLAAAFRPAPRATRAAQVLRMVAWATAAYLGWMVIYEIVLRLPIVPGHAEAIPWRPWTRDVVGDRDRVNVAILSRAGLRDLLFIAWVVGMPLLVVAASLWRTAREEVLTALCYAIPSTIFVLLFWPIQGLGVEMDLVFAAFPALYALAWVCAQDVRRTTIAAAILVSAHLAFWRIVLDTRFVNFTIS